MVGILIGLQISPQIKRTMIKIGLLAEIVFYKRSEYKTKSSLFHHSCDIVLRMCMFVWEKKCVYLCVYIVNIYIYTITMLCMYLEYVYIYSEYIHTHSQYIDPYLYI